METQNLVISFDYSWFLAKNLAYAECRIMKFHYRNSSKCTWFSNNRKKLQNPITLLPFIQPTNLTNQTLFPFIFMYAHTDRQEQMWVSLLSKKDQVMIESRPLATAPQPRLGCGQGRQRASYCTHTAFTCLLAFPTIITPSCFSGVIQQLRGPNLIQFWPPKLLVWTIVDILHTI